MSEAGPLHLSVYQFPHLANETDNEIPPPEVVLRIKLVNPWDVLRTVPGT